MVRRKFILILALLLLLGCTVVTYLRWAVFLRVLVEHGLNHASREYFDGTLRLTHISINREGYVEMQGLKGNFQTREGPVPVEIRSLRSLDPVFFLFYEAPVRFAFKGLRPADSSFAGLKGEALAIAGEGWAFELRADIESVGLEDLEWMNPRNLAGATGKMGGDLFIRNDYRRRAAFDLEVEVKEPGGNIQAGLLELLLPYLPQIRNQVGIEKLRKAAGLVGYKNARFTMDLVNPERLKVFLHILIPEYNLNLNLNIDITVDRENAFPELAQILGFVEVKTI